MSPRSSSSLSLLGPIVPRGGANVKFFCGGAGQQRKRAAKKHNPLQNASCSPELETNSGRPRAPSWQDAERADVSGSTSGHGPLKFSEMLPVLNSLAAPAQPRDDKRLNLSLAAPHELTARRFRPDLPKGTAGQSQ